MREGDFVYDALKLASDAAVAAYKEGYKQGHADGFRDGITAAQKVVEETFSVSGKAKEPLCAT